MYSSLYQLCSLACQLLQNTNYVSFLRDFIHNTFLWGLFHDAWIARAYYINMCKIPVLVDTPSKIGRSYLIEFCSPLRSWRYKLLGALLQTREHFCSLSVVMNFPLWRSVLVRETDTDTGMQCCVFWMAEVSSKFNKSSLCIHRSNKQGKNPFPCPWILSKFQLFLWWVKSSGIAKRFECFRAKVTKAGLGKFFRKFAFVCIFKSLRSSMVLQCSLSDCAQCLLLLISLSSRLFLLTFRTRWRSDAWLILIGVQLWWKLYLLNTVSEIKSKASVQRRGYVLSPSAWQCRRLIFWRDRLQEWRNSFASALFQLVGILAGLCLVNYSHITKG